MRNIFGREPYPGGKYLQEALTTTCAKLDNRPIGILSKACLLGGDTGARLMLEHNQRSLNLWQKGDRPKAMRLLEVWASTCMLTFMEDRDDQASVIRNTARNFASLFGSDPRVLETEFIVFCEARQSEQIRRASEKGSRGFTFEMLYLRSLKALGDPGVPSLDLLPKPWGTAYGMYAATNHNLPFDITILTDVADSLCVPDAFRAAMTVASDALPDA